MAAFTTMALLGLAGATGVLAGKRLSKPKPTTPASPAPLQSATTQPPIANPPDAAAAASDATKQAQGAAVKTRRRAASGSTTRYALPGGNPGGTASATPRTLIGS